GPACSAPPSTALADTKILLCSGGGAPLHLHLIHPGGGRPLVAPGDEGVQGLPRPLCLRLHRAVVQVPDPADQAPLLGGDGGAGPVEDPLDPPTDPQVHPLALAQDPPPGASPRRARKPASSTISTPSSWA